MIVHMLGDYARSCLFFYLFTQVLNNLINKCQCLRVKMRKLGPGVLRPHPETDHVERRLLDLKPRPATKIHAAPFPPLFPWLGRRERQRALQAGEL